MYGKLLLDTERSFSLSSPLPFSRALSLPRSPNQGKCRQEGMEVLEREGDTPLLVSSTRSPHEPLETDKTQQKKRKKKNRLRDRITQDVSRGIVLVCVLSTVAYVLLWDLLVFSFSLFFLRLSDLRRPLGGTGAELVGRRDERPLPPLQHLQVDRTLPEIGKLLLRFPRRRGRRGDDVLVVLLGGQEE